MSYPMDLDEYSYESLVAEVARRDRLKKAGLCDYCERAGGTKECKFPHRHAAAVTDDDFSKDLIVTWHSSEMSDSIYEFMKMSWEEYCAFVDHNKYPIDWRSRFK